jgi:hypothetical protein
MLPKEKISPFILFHLQRRLPSPGFQVEVVILDHDAPIPVKKVAEGAAAQSGTTGSEAPAPSTSHEWTDSEATATLNTAAVRKVGVDNTSTGMATFPCDQTTRSFPPTVLDSFTCRREGQGAEASDCQTSQRRFN